MNHARHRYSRIFALARLGRAGILLAVIALSGMFVIRADGWRSVHGIVRDRSDGRWEDQLFRLKICSH